MLLLHSVECNGSHRDVPYLKNGKRCWNYVVNFRPFRCLPTLLPAIGHCQLQYEKGRKHVLVRVGERAYSYGYIDECSPFSWLMRSYLHCVALDMAKMQCFCLHIEWCPTNARLIRGRSFSPSPAQLFACTLLHLCRCFPSPHTQPYLSLPSENIVHPNPFMHVDSSDTTQPMLFRLSGRERG